MPITPPSNPPRVVLSTSRSPTLRLSLWTPGRDTCSQSKPDPGCFAAYWASPRTTRTVNPEFARFASRPSNKDGIASQQCSHRSTASALFSSHHSRKALRSVRVAILPTAWQLRVSQERPMWLQSKGLCSNQEKRVSGTIRSIGTSTDART